MLAVGSSGLNWMTKLSWKARGCYRRVSFVTCIRRSVLRHGRALEEKGLQLVSCCQAAKMRMTGWISCYRRRTFGLPLQPGALSQRKSQRRHSAKSGKGCRPSISGGRSSYGGGCCLTFFFVPMPCALEALTVINPLFRLSISKGETITKVSQSPIKNQTKHHKANKTPKQTGHPKEVKHYAFRNFPMPLSTAPQRNSKYLS